MENAASGACGSNGFLQAKHVFKHTYGAPIHYISSFPLETLAVLENNLNFYKPMISIALICILVWFLVVSLFGVSILQGRMERCLCALVS